MIKTILTLFCILFSLTSFAEEKKHQQLLKFPSGLELLFLNEASGPTPKPNDIVTVNYKGTLTNGKEFDSSYARGVPASFPLNGVIKCWTEAVQKMAVGAKIKITCPPEIAYGAKQVGGIIPPNSTLIFEIELLKINTQ